MNSTERVVFAGLVIGGLTFVMLSLTKGLISPLHRQDDSNMVEAGDPPIIKIYDQERELNEDDQSDIQSRKVEIERQGQWICTRLGVIEQDVNLAQRDFESSVDQAFSGARKLAELVISDYRAWKRDDAVYEAQAEYQAHMAGYAGAVGVPLPPFPQRNPAYVDSLYRSALNYAQAVRDVANDVRQARVEFDRRINTIKNAILDVQLEFSNRSLSKLEVNALERQTRGQMLSLLKRLGPFLSDDDVPTLPELDAQGESSHLDSERIARWLENAETSTRELEARLLDNQQNHPDIKFANQLIRDLERGALK
jgi:hypothetical protein